MPTPESPRTDAERWIGDSALRLALFVAVPVLAFPLALVASSLGALLAVIREVIGAIHDLPNVAGSTSAPDTWRRRSIIRGAPGNRLLRVLTLVFGPKRAERLFGQAIADAQQEYFETLEIIRLRPGSGEATVLEANLALIRAYIIICWIVIVRMVPGIALLQKISSWVR